MQASLGSETEMTLKNVRKQIRKKCPHGRLKYYCSDCGGKGICSHGKQKYECADCGGNGICIHGRQKYFCADCGGNGICTHGRQKRQCVECGGKGVCVHHRLNHKHDVKKGLKPINNKCKHGRRKQHCTDCGGSRVCSHGRRKEQCADCNPFFCNVEGCERQHHAIGGPQNLKAHMRRMHTGHPKALTKQKELVLHDLLTKADVQFEYQKHLPFRSCGLASETNWAFIDFAIPRPWGVVLLECDEEQHSSYDASCDVRRDFDSQEKTVVLRYNPDAFQIGGKTRYTTKKARHEKLLEVLEAWKVDPAPNLGFARFFLFYDAESEDASLPSIAANWAEEVQQLSRRML